MSKIDEAFEVISRKDFVLPEYSENADMDVPLPIGHGQTISQPTTVRQMIEWLDPQPKDKVLDVGSGSGWTTALLGYIVGKKGHVYAVERIPDLLMLGESNCLKIGVKNVDFYPAEADYGLLEHAPYDRILVSAAADELPHSLRWQLKTGGKLVVPVHSDILEITKLSDTDWDTKTHSGYAFVPLI